MAEMSTNESQANIHQTINSGNKDKQKVDTSLQHKKYNCNKDDVF